MITRSDDHVFWPTCIRDQNQFDSIDLSDNAIVRLEGFPALKRLKQLLLSNNRIMRIGKNLEGEPRFSQRALSLTLSPASRLCCQRRFHTQPGDVGSQQQQIRQSLGRQAKSFRHHALRSQRVPTPPKSSVSRCSCLRTRRSVYHEYAAPCCCAFLASRGLLTAKLASVRTLTPWQPCQS